MSNVSHPNILVFMVDQFPARYLDPDSMCHLPNVRRLADEGVTFSETYSPSPHCCPARATFMTGLYPSRHGIWNNVNNPTAHSRDVVPDTPFFSDPMKQSGYRMALSGKWHISNVRMPRDCGWEELVPHNHLPEVKNLVERTVNRSRNFSTIRQFGHILRTGWPDVTFVPECPEGKNVYRESFHYNRAIGPAMEAIRTFAEQDNPWMIFASTDMAPGNPAPKKFLDLYDIDNIVLPPSFNDTMEDKPRVYQRMRNQVWGQLSEQEVRQSIASYMALCTAQDAMLGDMLRVLEETGQSSNTLVLFVGDHGDHQFAHGLLDMGIHAFRESYHVPAVVRWPGGISPEVVGSKVEELVSLADFAPTFLELAGAQCEVRLSGRSLVPFFRGQKPADWPDAVFHQTNGNELYFTQRTVRTKKWRYTYNGFDFDELYDLENDPFELKNLAFPDPAIQPIRYAPSPAEGEQHEPWPRLDEALEGVRQEMMKRLWEFSIAENDQHIFSAYAPVAMPVFGPGITESTPIRPPSHQ